MFGFYIEGKICITSILISKTSFFYDQIFQFLLCVIPLMETLVTQTTDSWNNVYPFLYTIYIFHIFIKFYCNFLSGTTLQIVEQVYYPEKLVTTFKIKKGVFGNNSSPLSHIIAQFLNLQDPSMHVVVFTKLYFPLLFYTLR